ncbi:MAG: hypothetical protein ACOC6G_00850 [Thermoproteota archaeon]
MKRVLTLGIVMVLALGLLTVAVSATDVSSPGNSEEALSDAGVADSVDDLTPSDVPDNTPCGCFYSPPPNTPQVLNNGDPVPAEAQSAND